MHRLNCTRETWTTQLNVDVQLEAFYRLQPSGLAKELCHFQHLMKLTRAHTILSSE